MELTDPTHTSHTPRFVPRSTKKQLIVIAVLVLIVAAAAAWYALYKKPVAYSSNPTIAAYQKQLPDLKAAVQKNPSDTQAHYKYAVALYATGDLQGAREQYQAHAKLVPQDATAQNSLGNVCRDLKDYSQAETAYKQAISLDAKAQSPYINLANMYLYTVNKKTEAIKIYEQAQKAMPDNKDIQVLLGIAYERTGDKASARRVYELVLSVDPNNAAAQAGLKRL